MADFNEILYGVPGGMATPVAVPEGVLPPQAAAPQEAPPVMAPQAAQPQAAPPQAPPQQESLGLFERLRSDPLLSQAALMAGIRLAQGPRPGQTALGLVGDAMLVGKTAHDMLQGNIVQEQRARETHQANMVRSAAQTEGQQLQNDETRQVMPSRVSALRSKAESLERAGQVEKALQVYEQAKAEFKSFLAKTDTSGMIERAAMQEILIPSLESASKLALQAGQTASAYGSANNQNAHAALANEQRTNPEKFNKGGGNTSAQIQAAEYLGEQLKKQGKSDEEVIRAKSDYLTQSKTKSEYEAFMHWAGVSGVDISTPKKVEEAMGIYNSTKALLGSKQGSTSQTAKSEAASGTPNTNMSPRDLMLHRLSKTPGAEGYTVGKLTPRGWEIFDKSGKLVHYGD